MNGIVLVVAKAPVPGLVKTRIAVETGELRAARIAAAALLDTLDSALNTAETRTVVALTGDLAAAQRQPELASLLTHCVVIPQRGVELPERLANAHVDVAQRYPEVPVVQIGMDTPQVTPGLLTGALTWLSSVDVVLGPATDGGWWALGMTGGQSADVLRAIPTSRSDTGARTSAALRATGLRLSLLPTLSDVDTLTDAIHVAAMVPHGRFAAEVSA